MLIIKSSPNSLNQKMKKIVRLLIASVFLLTAFSVNAGLILSGSGSYGGSIYSVYKYDGSADKTWDTAQLFALGQGGYLATLTTEAEDTFVTSLVQSLLGYHQEVWAGGYQQDTSGGAANNWTWVNGEGPFGYKNWSLGEPNDYYGPNSEQHLGINWTKNGTWNDEGDRGIGNIRGIVVESVPEPSVIALFAVGLLGLGFASRKKRS